MDHLHSISIAGSRTRYLDRGTGPVLLWVHGFPLDHGMWSRQVEFFADRYRVICPDLPGFGRSDVMPGNPDPMTMVALADWLVEFLGAVECHRPVHFGGLSMGGYIGWEFWRRHSARVRSIIACNTRAAADTDVIRRGRQFAATRVLETGARPVADMMVKKLFFQDRPTLASTNFYQDAHRVISGTDPKVIAAGQRGMAAREDATLWLPEIDCPVLFVAGQEDQIVPPAEIRANANLVSQAEFALIPGSGHLTPIEQPAVFNTAVDRFLS